MIAEIQFKDKFFKIDLSSPIDISLPLHSGNNNPNAWWAPLPDFFPVIMGDFIGSVAKGGPVNFCNVKFNPHGNGTHTECVGHIAPERFSVNNCLKKFWFLAQLVTIYPQKNENGDRIISLSQIKDALENSGASAFIIRTLPNDAFKKTAQYSGTNFPYFESEALEFLANNGIDHLLTDLPSVDREEDEGKLLAHHAFWNYPQNPRMHATISEMVFVPNEIKDGLYLLNLQIASFELDATPSKPVIYSIFG